MRLLLPLLLVGCARAESETDPGTSVGNPNMTRVALTVVEEGDWRHDVAEFPIRGVGLVSCERYREIWTLDQRVDLLGGTLVDPPLGAWCRQTWHPGGNVLIEGTLDDRPYRFELALGPIELEGTWEVEEEDRFIMEFGALGWLEAFRDRITSGEGVDVGPEDPLHDRIATAFKSGIGIYRDRDGDGVLSPEERRRWRLVSPVR